MKRVGPSCPQVSHPWLDRFGLAESARIQGWLYCTILYKGNEYLWILTSTGVLESIPHRYWGIALRRQEKWSICLGISLSFSSVQSLSGVDSLQPHEPQHARPPCPSPTPGVHPNPRPSSWWCHPAISSFVVPFSSCPPVVCKPYQKSTNLNPAL